MSFMDIVWFILISFAFVAYLMVMFSIIGDIFRDKDTSGVLKAIWLVALIFLPFVTAIAYVIVRGRGMAERQARSAEDLRAQQDAYIREVASAPAPADQIAQAQSLRDQGVISAEEFERLKQKALA
jgi:hypothetical protein